MNISPITCTALAVLAFELGYLFGAGPVSWLGFRRQVAYNYNAGRPVFAPLWTARMTWGDTKAALVRMCPGPALYGPTLTVAAIATLLIGTAHP